MCMEKGISLNSKKGNMWKENGREAEYHKQWYQLHKEEIKKKELERYYKKKNRTIYN